MNDLIRPPLLAAAFAMTALFAPAAFAQDIFEGSTSDGATYSVPTRWVVGQSLELAGKGWTDLAGSAGSTIAVVFDFGTVRAPVTIDGDDEVWAVIEAAPDGAWSFTLPFPETANWAAGETHKVHLLSGSLGANDRARGTAVDVTIAAP